MDIDPIVLMAYISVAINIITMIAACIAYAVFHVRKRRRKRPAVETVSLPAGPVAPVFLRQFQLKDAVEAPATTEVLSPALAEQP